MIKRLPIAIIELCSRLALSGSGCYRLRGKGLTETECLAHAKVDCQEGWAISKIARDDLLPSGRTKIESSKASDDNARPGQVSGKSWALREKRVAVRITPSRDIEWLPR